MSRAKPTAEWYQRAVDRLLAATSLEELEVVINGITAELPPGYNAKQVSHLIPDGRRGELEQYASPLHTLPHLVGALRRRFHHEESPEPEYERVEDIEGQMDVYEQLREGALDHPVPEQPAPAIRYHEQAADLLTERADEHRWEAARLIASELEAGKATQQTLADEIGKTRQHISIMARVWKIHSANHGLQSGSFDSFYQEVKGRPSTPELPTSPGGALNPSPVLADPTPEEQAESVVDGELVDEPEGDDEPAPDLQSQPEPTIQPEPEQKDEEQVESAIAEFPDLAFYDEQGKTEAVLRLAAALRGYEEPERSQRLENLRKTIEAERRSDENPADSESRPNYADLAHRIFTACNRASQAIASCGGPETVTEAVAGVDSLESSNWHSQFVDLAKACGELAEACKPTLRSVK